MGTWVQSDRSAPLGPGGSLTANLPVTVPAPPPPLSSGPGGFTHGPAGRRYGKGRGCRKPGQKCP